MQMAIRAERPAALGLIEAVTRAAFRDGLGHTPGRPAGREAASPALIMIPAARAAVGVPL